jgi:hypothetical protein
MRRFASLMAFVEVHVLARHLLGVGEHRGSTTASSACCATGCRCSPPRPWATPAHALVAEATREPEQGEARTASQRPASEPRRPSGDTWWTCRARPRDGTDRDTSPRLRVHDHEWAAGKFEEELVERSAAWAGGAARLSLLITMECGRCGRARRCEAWTYARSTPSSPRRDRVSVQPGATPRRRR